MVSLVKPASHTHEWHLWLFGYITSPLTYLLSSRWHVVWDNSAIFSLSVQNSEQWKCVFYFFYFPQIRSSVLIIPHSYFAQHCPSTSCRMQFGGGRRNKLAHSILAQLKSMWSLADWQRQAALHCGCSLSGISSFTLYDFPLLWHLPSLGITGHSTLKIKHFFLSTNLLLLCALISYNYTPNGTATISICYWFTAEIYIMVWNLYAIQFIASVACNRKKIVNSPEEKKHIKSH